MAKYLSAKEFRQQLPRIAEHLEQWREIVVVKRSKPLFKVVAFAENSSDLLNRAAAVADSTQPSLEEISRIVHQLRRA